MAYMTLMASPVHRARWWRARLAVGAVCIAVFMTMVQLPASHAEGLKIATWNLNWLTSRAEGLPDDVHARAAEDFDALNAYGRELDADLIAVQEVDTAATVHRVFPHESYSVHLTHDRVKQRTGFAVRRAIHYDINPDVTDIALHPEAHLRGGADITLRLPAGPVRVLGLHLKQGCQHARLGLTPGPVCEMLHTQFAAVERWIAARRDEGVSFVVLGDFNRALDRADPFAQGLRGAAPMIRATEGFGSPCWGRSAFIDHILIGGPARYWAVPDSLRVLTYRETDPAWKERLSDHCPVSVRLAPPPGP